MCFYFNRIWDHLKYYIESEVFNEYLLAASINQKIEDYWKILNEITTIASILDLRNKMSLFELGKLITNTINVLKN